MESVEERVLQLLTYLRGKKPQAHEEFVRDLHFEEATAVTLAMDLEELSGLQANAEKLCDPRLRYTVGQLIRDLKQIVNPSDI